MSKDSLARELARYAAGLRFEELPESTVHEVKRRYIDSLGCAMGAISGEPGTIARRLARTVSSTESATVLGTTHRSSPEWAAFSNGVHIRYLDYNDTYLSKEPAHPSDNIAAILAAGEPRGASGREIITATALAYEIQCRLCDAASIRARGWDHVTYGSFSTSLAAGRLLGLDEDGLVHAQGLAGTPNNAMRQTRVGELSMWKGCAFANASRNGVFAARLAAAGMTGPAPIFEGEMAFWNQVSGEFELDVAQFGGGRNPFMIDRSYIKFYPAEYHSQSAIDAALDIRREIWPESAGAQREEDDRLDDIASITIETFDAAVDIIGGEPEKWRPKSRETADHSLPYCVAVTLADGQVWMEQFDEARFTDERLLDLVSRVAVLRSAELSARYPEGIPNRVTVMMKDGTSHVREVTYPVGHAGNPMTDAQVEQKYRALCGPVLPEARIRESLDRCWNLESESDLSGLLGLFAVDA
jgi:2-methylcitrate dehydratase